MFTIEHVTRSDIKRIARIAQLPVERPLRYALDQAAFDMGTCAYMGRRWGDLDETSGFYGFREDAHVFEPFQALHNTSAFIYKKASALQDEPTNLRADTIMNQNIFYVNDIQTLHRESVARTKREASGQFMPIGTFESFLSSAILRGEKPWGLVRDYYKNLTKAMQINPPVTLALMQALGIDLISKNFPAIDTSQLSSVADAMDRWHEHKHEYKDGIAFFMDTFQKLGLLPREAQWEEIIKLLPRLEQFVNYNLSPQKLQSKKFYMRLVADESWYAYHRRTHINKYIEPITSLVVRRSDARILAFATNIPKPHSDEHDHAELITVSLARQFLNDPKNLLDGCDLYVSCDPCTKCGPELKKLRAKVYYGTKTIDGSNLFPDGGNLLSHEFEQLFNQIGWDAFVQ